MRAETTLDIAENSVVDHEIGDLVADRSDPAREFTAPDLRLRAHESAQKSHREWRRRTIVTVSPIDRRGVDLDEQLFGASHRYGNVTDCNDVSRAVAIMNGGSHEASFSRQAEYSRANCSFIGNGAFTSHYSLDVVSECSDIASSHFMTNIG